MRHCSPLMQYELVTSLWPHEISKGLMRNRLLMNHRWRTVAFAMASIAHAK